MKFTLANKKIYRDAQHITYNVLENLEKENIRLW